MVPSAATAPTDGQMEGKDGRSPVKGKAFFPVPQKQPTSKASLLRWHNRRRMLYIHFPNMARCVCVLATILHSIACYCTKLLLLQATMYYYATARATHCRQLVHSYGTTAILCACPTTHIWHLLHTLLNPKLVEISPSSSYFYLVRMFSLTLYWALCFSFERST